MLTRIATMALWLMLTMTVFLGLIGCSKDSPTAPAESSPASVDPAGISAVCSTDADCAEWEVRAGIPSSQRCDGEPCPQILHHNIPATMETGLGPPDLIVWVCGTQPRAYVSPDGRQTFIERDHYISRDRCPEVPIQ